MVRWIASIALGLAALLIVLLVAAWLLVGRFDLGPFAARRASAALGRPVAIGSLHVTPGRWITVELRGARLDNLPGGSRPVMAEFTSATAEVEALSLLRGPTVIRRLAVDGLQVLLERTADRTASWKFGPDRPAPPGPASRAWFPTLLDAGLTRSEVDFRTSSGALLRTRLDDMTIRTADAEQPVRLAGSGAYNDVPITLEADLAPIATLRDASVPYGTDLRLASGDTTLHFQGTMTEPLDLDGARGALALIAPTPAAILAIAGVSSDLDPALRLSGTLEHPGPLWQLTDASGALDDSAITAATLRLIEGGHGKPDDIAADLAFDQLDLNEVLGGGRRGSRADADLSLAVDRAPDTLVAARLSARQLAYAGIRAADVRLAAAPTPGRITVEELSLTYLGARIRPMAGSSRRTGKRAGAFRPR